MTYEQKRRLILFSFIAIILIIIVLIGYGCRNKSVENIEAVIIEEDQNIDALLEEKPSAELASPPAVLTPPFSEVRRTAKIYVERYGSYSSTSNFENINDVLYLSSNPLKERLQAVLDANQKVVRENVRYSGMTTRVLSDSIITGTPADSEVVLLLQTQRESSVGSLDNTEKFYQEIKVTLIKENNIWKVDSSVWLEQKTL